MTNKSPKHFFRKVPNLNLKLLRFYKIGSRLGLPSDDKSLAKHVDGLKIAGAGRQSMENFLSASPIANGNELQHQVMIEVYLGEGAWPFPEYYDATGRQRDEDLDAFHAALDEWFKLIRFQAQGIKNSNQNVEYDPRYLSAGLGYKKDRNELRLNITCGTLYSAGEKDTPLEFEQIAKIRVKEVTVEIFSEDDSVSFLKAKRTSSQSNFKNLDSDIGFRFYLETPEELPSTELFRDSTPWITYNTPEDGSRLIVEVRSGVPDYDINTDIIPNEQDRVAAHKIARAHMNNKLHRSTPAMDLGRIEEEFVVYHMSYSHYEEL